MNRRSVAVWAREAVFVTVVIGPIAAAVIVGAVIWRASQHQLAAERRLHAMILVSRVIEAHLDRSGNQWPRSWEEMSDMGPIEWAWMEWPRDIQALRADVVVDFEVTSEQVAGQTVEAFSAVKPTGDVFTVYQWHAVEPLLKRVKKGSAYEESLVE